MSGITLTYESPESLILSRGWTIFHGRDEGVPLWPDKNTLIFVLYRDGVIVGPKRAQRFFWKHQDDVLDVIAYIRADQFGSKQ